ncbi:MAG: sigma-70 family RNA polymerase sigma factor [Bacteroidota bacterium]
MMDKQIADDLSSNFRAYHGKLYGALLNQFGTAYLDDIDDVIQNTLIKAMRIWKPNQTPEKKESWLFIVAKNEMINHIKAKGRREQSQLPAETEASSSQLEDLRLKTILFLASQDDLSKKAKVLVILKNIFGLHVSEISTATLMGEEAIHKLLNRTKKKLTAMSFKDGLEELTIDVEEADLAIVEEILYAVFSVGFDSFDPKKNTVVNDDLCLESMALTQLLWQTYQRLTTQNLLALFCFHCTRLPAKVQNGKLIPFALQDRSKWNSDLYNRGFHYLVRPEVLDPYYLEALIISKHMSASEDNADHWQAIVKLYELWSSTSSSPLIRLNLAYSLYMAQESKEAHQLIDQLEQELPAGHFYLSMIKAAMIKEQDPVEYRNMVEKVMDGLDHQMRRSYLGSLLGKGFDT